MPKIPTGSGHGQKSTPLSKTLQMGQLQGRTPKVPLAKGGALIFWQSSEWGPLRSQIDTDQVIPSKGCVSTDPTDLAKTWGEWVFRYLRPKPQIPAFVQRTFQEELQAGNTFLIAGKNFGIGSSREMAVTGLLRAAKDAGREGNLVIVAGSGMGDIFRKNAINGGLHIVESDLASEQARPGDKFTFDPNTRVLTNESRGLVYSEENGRIKPFSPQEKAIYLQGGMMEVYKTLEFPRGRTRKPRHPRNPRAWESSDDQMPIQEQILERHRVFRGEVVEAGKTVHVRPDINAASDGTSPYAQWFFEQMTENERKYPPINPVIVQDHFNPRDDETYAAQMEISTQFAERWGLAPPHFTSFGGGIIHFVLPHSGLVRPGDLIAVADSHATTHGAYSAYGVGVGSTEIGMAWALGYMRLPVLKTEQITFTGKLPPWSTGKDIALALIASSTDQEGKWVGAEGHAVEYWDPEGEIPIGFRHTIANMGAELLAPVSLFLHDAITNTFMREVGIPPSMYPYGVLKPGKNANYVKTREFNLKNVVPMVARPFHPNQSVPAMEMGELVFIDQAALGSCTNGTIEDMLMAALVIHEARKQGISQVADNHRAGSSKVNFVAFPGSQRVAELMKQPHPLLEGASPFDVLISAGANIEQAACGHCFLAESQYGLRKDQVAVVTFNRNFARRNGVEGSFSYLASAYVVAASALLGYIGTPEELGMKWGPPFTQLFG